MAGEDPTAQDPATGFQWPPVDWTWAQQPAITAAPIAPVDELAQPVLPPPAPPAPPPVEDVAALPLPPIAEPAADLPQPPLPLHTDELPTPEVDAVTGVDAAPPAGSIIQQPPPAVPPRSAAAPGELPLNEQELVDLAHRDPVAFAKYNATKDAELADFARQRDAEIKRRDADDAEAAWRDRQAAEKHANDSLAALDAEATALAAEKPKKFTDSIGNVLSGLAAIFLGQFGAPATGGKNAGVDMLMRRMDAFADEQERDLARRGASIDRRVNIIGRLREQGMDAYQARETFRIATLARAREQLLTDMQNYDPRGTTARHIAGSVLQMEQQMAGAKEAVRKRTLDEALKLSAEARAQQKANDEHLAAQKKLAGGTGGAALDKQKFTSEQLAKMFPGKPVPADGIPRTTREYDQWVATSGKGEELISKQRTNEQFETEQQRQFSVRGPDTKFLLGEDDKPVKMKDVDEAKQLTQSIADTDEYLRMMDEVLRLRKKYGWSSDLFKSPEWRQVKTLWGEAVLQKKDVNKLGALTGSDLERLHEAMGASDPTSLRDPTPGIETARRNAVSKLQTNLRARGVGDKHLPQYPETWKNQAPTATAVDEAISEVTKADQLVDDRPGKIPLGPTGAPAGSTKEAYEAFKAQTGQVRDRVQFLEDTARGGGDNAKKARQGLVELASGKAGHQLMKDAAAQALRNLDASESATKEETK